MALKVEQNDCRKGIHLGAMAASGTSSYDSKLIDYKNTTEHFGKLELAAYNYFKKYGFIKWVTNLHNRVANTGGLATIVAATGIQYPWYTLCVTSHNYANESHIDTNGALQGISIWHKKAPQFLTKGVQRARKELVLLIPCHGDIGRRRVVEGCCNTSATWDHCYLGRPPSTSLFSRPRCCKEGKRGMRNVLWHLNKS